MAEQESPAAPADSVECGAALEPIIRLSIVTLVCLGFGVYSIYELYIDKYADNPTYYWFTLGCAVVLTPVGLALAGVTIAKARRRLIADAEGIGYVGRDKIRWDQVTRIVVRGKGLMDLHYEDEGETEVLELDSYKLKSFDALVRQIEARTEGKPVEQK